MVNQEREVRAVAKPMGCQIEASRTTASAVPNAATIARHSMPYAVMLRSASSTW
jgi:hypothetical protein